MDPAANKQAAARESRRLFRASMRYCLFICAVKAHTAAAEAHTA